MPLGVAAPGDCCDCCCCCMLRFAALLKLFFFLFFFCCFCFLCFPLGLLLNQPGICSNCPAEVASKVCHTHAHTHTDTDAYAAHTFACTHGQLLILFRFPFLFFAHTIYCSVPFLFVFLLFSFQLFNLSYCQFSSALLRVCVSVRE